jgi:hypothetical protein
MTRCASRRKLRIFEKKRTARMARLLHDLIRLAFAEEGQTGDLHAQYSAFTGTA